MYSSSKIHTKQSPDIMTVEAGAAIDIKSGAAIKANGTQASAINTLTGGTGGAASDALQVIPDPADSPATADALRDDLVANVLPTIRNDIADVTAKVNAMLAALRGVGAIAP